MPTQPGKTVYIVTGNPDTVDVSPTDFTSLGHNTGELGLKFEFRNRKYQIVQVDSGVSASNPVGVIAANQLAYWKDKVNYLVTNDRRQAEGGAATGSYQNKVAGVFRAAITSRARVNGYGTVCCILQKATNINVLDGGNTFAVGEAVIAEADSVAACDRVAVGTATTNQQLGWARGAASGGVVAVDLDIADIV